MVAGGKPVSETTVVSIPAGWVDLLNWQSMAGSIPRMPWLDLSDKTRVATVLRVKPRERAVMVARLQKNRGWGYLLDGQHSDRGYDTENLAKVAAEKALRQKIEDDLKRLFRDDP